MNIIPPRSNVQLFNDEMPFKCSNSNLKTFFYHPHLNQQNRNRRILHYTARHVCEWPTDRPM